MNTVIVGLGNPGAEYDNTRHNAGRMLLELIAKKEKLEWREDKKGNALVAKGEGYTLVLPNTFMNKSGGAVARFAKSVKAAESVVVAYDDLDMPLGKLKISFNRSSGGHNGLKSIERALKTQKFWRLRMGVSGSTASGKIKKPHGEEAVLKYILGKFKPAEQDELKKVFKKAAQAIQTIVADGPVHAMNQFN